ncbi:MAG: ABC transporter permease [Trueperaceae bacterium]|nr:ABC transporter permease [Trueperaceae bacterium]
MTTFLLRRTAQALFTVWVVATLVFALLHVAGDPAQILAPPDMNQIQVAELREALGLDEPIWVQYGVFLGNLLQGDLGISYYNGRPALELVLERLPATFELVLSALAIALVVGVPLGILAALSAGSRLDRALRFISVIGISAPTFWIGIMLILVFSVEWGLLPSSGRGGPINLVLPAVTLSLFSLAFFLRIVRSSFLEVLTQDFVRTARAKGLPRGVVNVKHALRNALIPFVTIAGLQFGQLLTSSVVTETIFAWPGMNRLVLQAMYRLDYPIILAFAIVVAVTFATINLVVDVVYGFVDPRVRHA